MVVIGGRNWAAARGTSSIFRARPDTNAIDTPTRSAIYF